MEGGQGISGNLNKSFSKGTAITVTNIFFCIFKIPAFCERECDLFILGHLSSYGPVNKGDRHGITRRITTWLLTTHSFCFLPKPPKRPTGQPEGHTDQNSQILPTVLTLISGSFNFNLYKLKFLLKYSGHTILWVSGIQQLLNIYIATRVSSQ